MFTLQYAAPPTSAPDTHARMAYAKDHMSVDAVGHAMEDDETTPRAAHAVPVVKHASSWMHEDGHKASEISN